MNEAERRNPGGEWRSGALGTEEELCYKTSLSLTYDDDAYEVIQHQKQYNGMVPEDQRLEIFDKVVKRAFKEKDSATKEKNAPKGKFQESLCLL